MFSIKGAWERELNWFFRVRCVLQGVTRWSFVGECALLVSIKHRRVIRGQMIGLGFKLLLYHRGLLRMRARAQRIATRLRVKFGLFKFCCHVLGNVSSWWREMNLELSQNQSYLLNPCWLTSSLFRMTTWVKMMNGEMFTAGCGYLELWGTVR